MVPPTEFEAMVSEIIEKLRGLAELSGLDRRERAWLFGIAACEACWRCLSPDRQRDSPLRPGICPHDLPGWSRSWAKTFLAAIERVTPEAYAQAFFLARAAQQGRMKKAGLVRHSRAHGEGSTRWEVTPLGRAEADR